MDLAHFPYQMKAMEVRGCQVLEDMVYSDDNRSWGPFTFDYDDDREPIDLYACLRSHSRRVIRGEVSPE